MHRIINSEGPRSRIHGRLASKAKFEKGEILNPLKEAPESTRTEEMRDDLGDQSSPTQVGMIGVSQCKREYLQTTQRPYKDPYRADPTIVKARRAVSKITLRDEDYEHLALVHSFGELTRSKGKLIDAGV